ncbi:MAG TPA: hypothetical protein VMM15_11640 [Bradyrhizobium sp.]|nr:hypothetical protein [Bradyrhizobium sp.]
MMPHRLQSNGCPLLLIATKPPSEVIAFVAILPERAGNQFDSAGGFGAVLCGRWDEAVNRSEGHETPQSGHPRTQSLPTWRHFQPFELRLYWRLEVLEVHCWSPC